MLRKIKNLIYPPKCALCKRILKKDQTDLCPDCREHAPEFISIKKKISFVAGWTAVWYYKGSARKSIIDYKFHNQRYYSKPYGRLLAMKLLSEGQQHFDLVTWVPLSMRRTMERGFDQVHKIGITVSRELEIPLVRTLKKTVHNKPQSSIVGVAQRRANTLGVFAPYKPADFAGKRILLLDDIITTGATAEECAKTLMIAGAKEVYFAAVAATQDYKSNR